MSDVLAPEREPTEPGGPPGTSPPRRDPRRGNDRPTASGWFRAFWRWHFFASFLVVADPADARGHRADLPVPVPAGAAAARRPDEGGHQRQRRDQPALRQPAGRCRAGLPRCRRPCRWPSRGRTATRRSSRSSPPTAPAAMCTSTRTRAKVLGSLDPDTTLSGYAIRLHGELMAGPWGDHVIELGACWAFVMALTGYYLFVRGWRTRRRARKNERRGAKLRHRHGLIGAVAGVGPAHPTGDGAAVDRAVGREGAELRDRTRLLDVEHRPWRPERPDLDPGRVTAPQPRQDVPWAMGDSEVPQSAPPTDG